MTKHRLVAIGDGLAQGFTSGAIFAADLSYPSIIAEAMGLDRSQFCIPSFHGHGGLPFNIEYWLRRLGERYGNDLQVLELLGAPFRLRGWLSEAEEYWERGGGARPQYPLSIFHNLASWGMTVDDAVHLTAGYCASQCAQPTSANLFSRVPKNAFYRTLLSVINPAQRVELASWTVLDCARELSIANGIENLIVALGVENALGTITQLEIRPTDDRIQTDPAGSKTLFNLWRPEHFAAIYRQLVQALQVLHADRVFLATVPHVTIFPLVRGVGKKLEHRLFHDPRYFKFYTYFWICDEVFDPEQHPHLTGDQAKEIDATIDAYNVTIRDAVADHQARGLQWFLVDLCDVFEQLAFRRYQEIGLAPSGGVYEFPSGWIQALQGKGLSALTTHYLEADQNRVQRGGMFGLDGVHPTTMGYALVAQEFIKVMQQEAHVPFLSPITGSERLEPIQLNYSRMLRRDTLVNTPPSLLDDAVATFRWLEDWVGLRSILGGLA